MQAGRGWKGRRSPGSWPARQTSQCHCLDWAQTSLTIICSDLRWLENIPCKVQQCATSCPPDLCQPESCQKCLRPPLPAPSGLQRFWWLSCLCLEYTSWGQCWASNSCSNTGSNRRSIACVFNVLVLATACNCGHVPGTDGQGSCDT